MNKLEENLETNDDLTDTERMINTGIEVELKTLGKVRVRELSLEKLVIFGRDASNVMDTLNFSVTDQQGVGWVLKILADPEAQKALRACLASSTGLKSEVFENLGVRDWLLLATTLKQVHDWEEIKELFFQLVPKDRLPQASSEPTKEETPTSEPNDEQSQD
jgi:hypothetical protein